MSIAIGIDLGTTNTVCSFIDANTPNIIPNAEGQRITPSVVGYRDGKRVVGRAAKRQIQLYPESTIHSIKRFIGRRFTEAQSDLRMVNYHLESAIEGLPLAPYLVRLLQIAGAHPSNCPIRTQRGICLAESTGYVRCIAPRVIVE